MKFTGTDRGFQRASAGGSSNLFIARWILPLEKSMVVTRFRNPRGIGFS
jgi:phosphoribulokinase